MVPEEGRRIMFREGTRLGRLKKVDLRNV